MTAVKVGIFLGCFDLSLFLNLVGLSSVGAEGGSRTGNPQER